MAEAARNTALAKAVFRGLLRWARDHGDVPLSLRAADLYAAVPALRTANFNFQESRTVAVIARFAFWDAKDLTDEPARAAVDRGLDALRTLNSSYAAAAAEMRRTREARTDRAGVTFRVGQVFIHKKFGYRGVVYGWDPKCARDEAWVEQMAANPDVPFYYVLPDEADCQRRVGGVRLTKYVGQDNMLPLEGGRVVHRALDSYFKGYSPAKGRYIPVERLAYEYPDDDYELDEDATLTPVEEDANLLLHPEPGEGGGGEGGGEAVTREAAR